jgi:hypothetical protein
MDEQIFPFQDGTRAPDGSPLTVYGDPREIQDSMSASLGGDVTGVAQRSKQFDHETKVGSPPEIAEENTLRMVKAIRKAFALPPFDRATGLGATVNKCISVWNEFCAFMAEKKNPPASTPTSRAPTAPG